MSPVQIALVRVAIAFALALGAGACCSEETDEGAEEFRSVGAAQRAGRPVDIDP
jgi:hypothetical protein